MSSAHKTNTARHFPLRARSRERVCLCTLHGNTMHYVKWGPGSEIQWKREGERERKTVRARERVRERERNRGDIMRTN